MKSLHFGPTSPPDPKPATAAPAPSQPATTPESVSLLPFPSPESAPVTEAPRPIPGTFSEVPVAEFDWKHKRKLVKVVSVIRYCGQFTLKDVRPDEKVMLPPTGRSDPGFMVRRCRTCQGLFVPTTRMSLDCPKCFRPRESSVLKDAEFKAEVRKMAEWICADGKKVAILIDRPDVVQKFEFGGFGQIRCTPRVRYFAQRLAMGDLPVVASYLSDIPGPVATELMAGTGNPRKFNEIKSYFASRHICVQIAAELSEMDAQLRSGTSVNTKGKVLEKMPTTERMKMMQRKVELWALYLEHHAKEPDQDVSLGALDDILPEGTNIRQAGEQIVRDIARDATGMVGLYGFGKDRHE